jgi:hypothetical protein
MKKIVLVFCCVLLATMGWANTKPKYEYPIDNRYEATVVGTPMMYMAPVPMEINSKNMAMKVFKDRKTPKIFWYSDKLKYSLAYQKEKAPLIFIIAGTGAAYDSSKMKYLQRAFFQAGFHVICLTSPTHLNFIVTASTSMVPGHIEEDSEDLYRVMELAWEQVKDDIDVSEFHLTGYSLGAAQAAFVSKLDEERKSFDFQKVLMINPPVNLFNSAEILDKMLVENIPGGPDNINAFLDRFFQGLSVYYKENNKIDLSDPDLLYDMYQRIQPEDTTLEALIGISFRLSSGNMIFTSDVMKNAGYIVPEGAKLVTGSSLTNFGTISYRTGFMDYFDEYFYPYFRKMNPGLTREELIREESLESVESYLKNADKIGLMHNQDDIILKPGEIDFFRRVFGVRATIYPNGGHCGNMMYSQFVANMINFFNN